MLYDCTHTYLCAIVIVLQPNQIQSIDQSQENYVYTENHFGLLKRKKIVVNKL